MLGFPCNQFGQQEPGGDPDEIVNGIKYVRPGNGFFPNFQLLKKGDVNGGQQHPLYTYLKKHCKSPEESFRSKYKLYYDTFHVNDIRWNWEKFLISREGFPIWRAAGESQPSDFLTYLKNLIAEGNTTTTA